MRLTALSIAAMAVAICSSSANAATVTITALDIRSSGVFGHDPNVSAVTINGAAPAGTVTADPIDVTMTYSNLDLDNDGSANDEVTFTMRWAGGGGTQRAFNQGVDTGFGNLNDVTVSMLSVSGMTTDNGVPILFDGFTGAAAGFGGNGDLESTVEINGSVASVLSPSTGSFQFLIDAIDFAPTATVLFDNSVRTGIGTIVARHYDLQFSAIPEPASALLLGLGLVGFVARRRV